MKPLPMILMLALVPAPVLADGWFGRGKDGDRHGRGTMVVTHEATKTECSDCHMAYPPGFLPARSWQALMTDLPNHFGEDASLDESKRAEIEAWLVANAADAGGRTLRGVAADQTPLRISELPWFKREHEGEVTPRMLEKAKSMANCVACHSGAERGNFDDD